MPMKALKRALHEEAGMILFQWIRLNDAHMKYLEAHDPMLHSLIESWATRMSNYEPDQDVPDKRD